MKIPKSNLRKLKQDLAKLNINDFFNRKDKDYKEPFKPRQTKPKPNPDRPTIFGYHQPKNDNNSDSDLVRLKKELNHKNGLNRQ